MYGQAKIGWKHLLPKFRSCTELYYYSIYSWYCLAQLLNSINLRQWKVSIVTAFRKHPYTVCAVKRKFAHTVCVQMLTARRHDADFAHVRLSEAFFWDLPFCIHHDLRRVCIII